MQGGGEGAETLGRLHQLLPLLLQNLPGEWGCRVRVWVRVQGGGEGAETLGRLHQLMSLLLRNLPGG